MEKTFAISTKIYAALLVTSVVLLLITILFFSHDEKMLAEHLIEDTVQASAQNYFDAVNTMMLTGTVSNRKMVQDKILQQRSIVEARIIRSDKTSALYGAGFSDQKPLDGFERNALLGQEAFQIIDTDNGRVMQYVMPIAASADYRGTNCLACHQAKEGDILGAVKMSYDLSEIDSRISTSIVKATLMQIVVIAVGFGLLAAVVYKLVLFRLKRLGRNIDRVADQLDLSEPITVYYQDELGAVSRTFNHMMGKFKESLLTVSDANDKIAHSAQEVDDIANLSKEAVLQQKAGTESVAAAINQLDASATEIELNTKAAANKSDLVAEKTEQGLHLAEDTKQGINGLKDSVVDNSKMIEQLNTKTEDVGQVLDVITAIAEQTNLLALNAAIEAARAGEQGRGFAVVADEVRTLAKRTQDSIGQIQDTISALQKDARNAVIAMSEVSELATEKAKEVEQVSVLLTDISSEIKDLDCMNVQIANAAHQQNLAAEEINMHVVSIKDVADQSSEDVIRGKEISEHLLALAFELNQQVSRFKL